MEWDAGEECKKDSGILADLGMFQALTRRTRERFCGVLRQSAWARLSS